jgi:hypothetical protein
MNSSAARVFSKEPMAAVLRNQSPISRCHGSLASKTDQAHSCYEPKSAFRTNVPP